jgi:hypothetical protein
MKTRTAKLAAVSLHAGEQVRAPEAGVNRLHLLGPHSREVHQLLMEACVGSRSVPAGDRLQCADDERGKPDSDGTEGQQWRESGRGIDPERVLNLGERPSPESDAYELSPSETPSTFRPVLLASVVRGFPSQGRRCDSKESRTLGKAVGIGSLEEEDSDTFLFRKVAHTGIGYILYHIDARGSCDVK